CGRKSGRAVCILPLMPRCRPSQFSLENRKNIHLPRASEVKKRAPVSSLRRPRVSVPRKTRLSACCAILITRFPMPAFHCRLKYSTSASSGIVKPKRVKSRLKREARASCRSRQLAGTLGEIPKTILHKACRQAAGKCRLAACAPQSFPQSGPCLIYPHGKNQHCPEPPPPVDRRDLCRPRQPETAGT